MFPARFESSYKDIRLFLWLIPCINVINYYLTYQHFGSFWRVIATFTIDTMQGYIAWFFIRSLILALDKKIPYGPRPLRRIVIQVALTFFAGCGAIILLTELVNWLATSRPVPVSFYTKDIFIISIWIFVINGIYIGLHYHNQWQLTELQRKKEAEIRVAGFAVSNSKKDIIFPFEDILGFYIDGDYSVLVSSALKKTFVDSSLDTVEMALPQSFFFRLNRQYIVHRQVITGYEKAANSKLNVILKPTGYLPTSIPVSRTKAAGFKVWFLPT